MSSAIVFIALFAAGQAPLKAPTFSSPPARSLHVPSQLPVAPRLEPPSGYKAVSVPDYVASTYMDFARTETAHDYKIANVENRLVNLETLREKTDHPDIESLKDTRSKALIYLTIGSTLWTVVWGLLAAFIGYLFKEQILPRMRFVWKAIGPHTFDTWSEEGIAIHADAPEGQGGERDQSKT